MGSKKFGISARAIALLCSCVVAATLAIGCSSESTEPTNGDGGAGAASQAGASGKAGSNGKAGSGGKADAGSAGAAGEAGANNEAGSSGADAGDGGMGGAATGGSGGNLGTAGGGTGGSAGNGEPSVACNDPLECTDGSTSSASPICSNTCTTISTKACVDCENAGDCFESVDNCVGLQAPTPFTSAQQTQCFSVISCIQATNCFDGTGTLGKCYCGDLSIQACGAAPFSGAGSPNGACVAQIKAGFPTFTTNIAVLGGLVATDFPSGAAMKRLSCQKGANQTACLETCGFASGGPAFP